jgi:hypothetical protein
MAGFLARSGRRSIDLSASAYLELGLGALQVGDYVRAVGAFASIDDDSWTGIVVRFPWLPEWLEKLEASR